MNLGWSKKTGDVSSSNSILVGAVQYFARQTAPEGWLKADGSAVSRIQYADLFAAVGTMFGEGDGSTTFNLPDLRGEFIRGFDNGRGVDPGRSIGSNQISTQILVDNNEDQVVGIIDWKSNNLTSLGYEEAASGLSPSIHWVNSSVKAVASSSYLRSIRPRNVALLACIKY